MFKTDRIFSAKDPFTGAEIWYFLTREGRKGPFRSEAEANLQLADFIARCQNNPKRMPRTRFLASSYG